MAGLTRREFLDRSCAVLGGSALAGLPLGCSLGPASEGIYTDRFTYRTGDDIGVHMALLDAPSTTLTLTRMDAGFNTHEVVFQHPGVRAGDQQNLFMPGVFAADFERVLSLSTSGLVPGYYRLEMDPDDMRPENVSNTWTKKTTHNWYTDFVVSNANPGSRSRILWVHDSLSSVAYGTFGYASIYGDTIEGRHTPWVSYARPSLTRSNWQLSRPLGRMNELGFEAELIDLIQLQHEDPDFLDNYDLVIVVGKFEYVTHDFMDRLVRFRDGGGNIVVAATEFAIFRVRLESWAKQLVAYKGTFAVSDGVTGPDPYVLEGGDPDLVAGTGMNMAGSHFETSVVGGCLWAANRVAGPFTLHHMDQAGWILEGTGLGEGDTLTSIADSGQFSLGNLVDFDGAGKPYPVDFKFAPQHWLAPIEALLRCSVVESLPRPLVQL